MTLHVNRLKTWERQSKKLFNSSKRIQYQIPYIITGINKSKTISPSSKISVPTYISSPSAILTRSRHIKTLFWKMHYQLSTRSTPKILQMVLITFSLNLQWGLNFKIISLFCLGFFPGSFQLQHFGFQNFSAWGSLTRHKLSKYASKLVLYEFCIWTLVFQILHDCFLKLCSHNQSLIRIVITGLSVISIYSDWAVKCSSH
jgi:hypothetical protein